MLGLQVNYHMHYKKKDQDIVNVISLVKVCKQQHQMMRESGWSSLLDKVSYICEKYSIDILNMNGIFLTIGRSRRKAHEITNFILLLRIVL